MECENDRGPVRSGYGLDFVDSHGVAGRCQLSAGFAGTVEGLELVSACAEELREHVELHLGDSP